MWTARTQTLNLDPQRSVAFRSPSNKDLTVIENPWTRLPVSKPFVLTEDAPILALHNGIYQLHCRPDPYVGRLDAPVVVLSLNPGYTAPTAADPRFSDDWWHQQPVMIEAYLRNFGQDTSSFPMFFLDPVLSQSPGGRYWSAALSDFIAECGREAVANNLLVIESLPYHSFRYSGGPVGLNLPSLAFSHYQINEAMKRNATIVIWRHKSGFEFKVPGLASYPYVSVRNARSKYLSRGNVLDFNRVANALATR